MRLLNLARPLMLTLFVFFFSSVALNAQTASAITEAKAHNAQQFRSVVASNCLQTSVSKNTDSDTLIEEFSFLIQDFKINHQSEINNLNIKLRYCYETGIVMSQYPDFTDILKDIQGFLNNYPNETDYWEILNKKLTQRVLRKYPVLSSVTSEMQVSPSAMIPYTRSTIVTRYQSK